MEGAAEYRTGPAGIQSMSNRLNPMMNIRVALSQLPLGRVLAPSEIDAAPGASPVRTPLAVPSAQRGVHIVYAARSEPRY